MTQIIDNENTHLTLITEKLANEIWHWKKDEVSRDLFSCRPIPELASQKEYANEKVKNASTGGIWHYVLVSKVEGVALGEIFGFDHNLRNHSIEFGFYLPKENRNKRLGSKMVSSFLDLQFANENLSLNKIYATTCIENTDSCNLLSKFGFSLDGRNRDHYWIGDKRLDQCVFSILRDEWELINKEF